MYIILFPKILKPFILLSICILTSFALFAQNNELEYYNKNYTINTDKVFNENIRSTQFNIRGNENTLPVLLLNTTSIIDLDFDDLEADAKSYFYSVEHCDANWNLSDLSPNDYLQGFSEDRISEFRFSSNAIVRYTHYHLSFPNNQMSVSLSGNYILKVYEKEQKNKLILTRRFMVVEPILNIQPNLARSPIINDRTKKQKINFSVLHPTINIENPFNQIKIWVLKNERWDIASYNDNPIFIKPQELVYDGDLTNVFDGGNEYRRIDIRSFKFKSERIADLSMDSLYKLKVLADYSRNTNRYVSEMDNNGNFFIRSYDVNNTNNQGDYGLVKFELKTNGPVNLGNIYLVGKFNDYALNAKSKLKYIDSTQSYVLETLLKQGVYDYQYGLKEDGKEKLNETFFEGDFYETRNSYSIFVYFRKVGSRYDELLGYIGF